MEHLKRFFTGLLLITIIVAVFGGFIWACVNHTALVLVGIGVGVCYVVGAAWRNPFAGHHW
jgi:hypothetical protein